jgi:hypothetical protein
MDPRMMMSSGGGNTGSGLSSFFGGLFGDSGEPYKDAMKQYQEWANKAQGVQQPYLDAGKRGMGNFEDWLGGIKDPSSFINHLMNGYQESPWAKFSQDQATRAAQNQGSASGLTGSTPLMQFAQQNAQNISSQDMNQWLSHVLGINTQYGTGESDLMHGGQNSANALTNMYGDLGRQMGDAAYGRRAGEQQDRNNMWGGLFDMFKNGLFG